MIILKFGEGIKKLRSEKGLTSSELAKRSGISQAYLSQLESGKNKNPTPDILNKLSKGLGLSYAYFLIRVGYIDFEQLKKEAKEETDLSFTLNKTLSSDDSFDLNEVIKIEYNLKYKDYILTTEDKVFLKELLERTFKDNL